MIDKENMARPKKNDGTEVVGAQENIAPETTTEEFTEGNPNPPLGVTIPDDVVDHSNIKAVGWQDYVVENRANELEIQAVMETHDRMSPQASLKVKRLPHGAGLPEIAYQTANAAGMDLYAAIDHTVQIKANGGRVIIPTGIKVEIPANYEGQVRPRSGLAAKHGITVLNSPGTIDADYRGEIQIILINTNNSFVRIEPGDRIAQLVIAPVVQLPVVYVDELTETERGEGKFGSTGIK
jgi:dUTP pyrophosphatase